MRPSCCACRKRPARGLAWHGVGRRRWSEARCTFYAVPHLCCACCACCLQENMLRAFKHFDTDGSGTISRDELRAALKVRAWRAQHPSVAGACAAGGPDRSTSVPLRQESAGGCRRCCIVQCWPCWHRWCCCRGLPRALLTLSLPMLLPPGGPRPPWCRLRATRWTRRLRRSSRRWTRMATARLTIRSSATWCEKVLLRLPHATLLRACSALPAAPPPCVAWLPPRRPPPPALGAPACGLRAGGGKEWAARLAGDAWADLPCPALPPAAPPARRRCSSSRSSMRSWRARQRRGGSSGTARGPT